jgi:pimeloyl-ACP methyl ester carboxylesterase
MAGAIPGARLVVVPAAGHLSNLGNSEAFNAALGGFVTAL